MRGRHSHEVLVACAAAFVLVAHLSLARPSPEDIDSLNFALAVRDYDVARHQPHPPGYPLLILAANGTAWLSQTLRPTVESPETAGLVLLAALAGAVAVVAGRRVLLEAGCSHRAATVAAGLFACAPLPWITAERPLSDMPGLAAGLVGQLLLLRAVNPVTPPWRLAGAGLWVGLAIGVRSQVLWLTLPLAAVVAVQRIRSRSSRDVLVLGGALCAGVVTWLVPMLVLSGGFDDYLHALGDQADDDFDGVPMLATSFGPRRLALALFQTFVQPWALWPLAMTVIGSAAAGAFVLAARAPRVLATILLLSVPYAIYHLLFQETETTRYALPLVLPMCALVAVMLEMPRSVAIRGAAATVVVVIAGVFLGVSLRASWQFRTEPERVTDVRQALAQAAAARRPDVVLMHRRVWAETERARDMAEWPGAFETVPASREWMHVVPWLDRPRVQAWWLVDPQRGDRVAIDPRSVTQREQFGWPAPLASLLGGMRPHPFEWLVIDDPSWVLHDGWALTPELAGLSSAAASGPASANGATATVRARPTPRTLLIGGRLVKADSGPVTVTVSIGDAWHDTMDVQPGAFHYTWTVPPSAAPRHTNTLTVRATGPAADALMLEQFDIQPAGVPVVALADGWYEPERDVTTGRRWRWMADRARVDVLGARCDLRMTFGGTWPRHYDDPPLLSVRAGDRVIADRRTLSRPFRVTMDVPRAAVDAAGRVTLEFVVDRSFVAGAETGTADARRLSVEVTDLVLEPRVPGSDCTPDVDSVTHESVRFRRQVTRGH